MVIFFLFQIFFWFQILLEDPIGENRRPLPPPVEPAAGQSECGAEPQRRPEADPDDSGACGGGQPEPVSGVADSEEAHDDRPTGDEALEPQQGDGSGGDPLATAGPRHGPRQPAGPGGADQQGDDRRDRQREPQAERFTGERFDETGRVDDGTGGEQQPGGSGDSGPDGDRSR